MLPIDETDVPFRILHRTRLLRDAAILMAKPPSKQAGKQAPSDTTAKSPAPPGKRTPAGVTGNGNRSALQAELDLTIPEPEEAPVEALAEALADAPAAPPPSLARAEPLAAPEPTAAAPPAMRELGLSGKEAWKVDLKGKRVALDDKGWREELGRALGRAPAKG